MFLKGAGNSEFIPSVESDAVSDRFLPAHPEVLAKTANPGVPVISGLNDMEGLLLFEGKLLFYQFSIVQ